MDSDRFDAITQRLANATSRRGAFRALVAAAAAAVGARVGLDAEAAKDKKDKKGKDNDRCVDLGGKCGGKPKKGKKPPKCCGDGQCKAGRCACPSGKKECNGKCIKNNACCTNSDCDGGKQCRKNTCACPDTMRECNGTCIDNNACCANGDCGAGRVCGAGNLCVCAPGSRECIGSCLADDLCCVDDDCDGDEICRNDNSCGCPAGTRRCAGSCLSNDVCCPEETCPNGGTCNTTSGDCECSATEIFCGSVCTNTATNANHCGACNNACDNGESCVAGECVVVVTTDEKGWVFFDNTTLPGSPKTNGTVEFVAGPGTAPIGSGSAEFKTTLGSDKATLSNPSFDGMALADITEFRYSTYSHPGSGHIVPAVKLEIEYDFNGGKDTAHLIFEPVYYGSGPNPVVEGQWQTWNLIGPDAEWWAFNSSASPQANYVSWAEMLNRHPGAVITGDYEGKFLHLETGSGTANKTGNADKLVVNGTIYDFEPAASGANAARKKDKKREGR